MIGHVNRMSRHFENSHYFYGAACPASILKMASNNGSWVWLLNTTWQHLKDFAFYNDSTSPNIIKGSKDFSYLHTNLNICLMVHRSLRKPEEPKTIIYNQ